MKNIHVLPKKSFNQIGVDHYGKTPTQIKIAEFLINKKIYITSNEEIKEGVNKWYLDKFLNKPYNSGGAQYGEKQNVIILTTDQDLIKDGVQPIDDEFLEWFNKNRKCENVHVYKEHKQINQDNIVTKGNTALVFSHYVIYIPQEEPKQNWQPTQGEKVWIKVFSNWSTGTYIGYDITKKMHLVREDEEGGGHLFSSSEILPYNSTPNEPKQETLEEAAEKWVFETNGAKWSNNDDTAGDNFGSFKAGAKWQQERMYSEEEVKQIIDTTLIEYSDFVLADIPHWFEQFKKK